MVEHFKDAYKPLDYLVVHGAGVEQIRIDGVEYTVPSFDGMVRTIAAVHLLETGAVSRLIFSGTHTAGRGYSSEAQASFNFLHIPLFWGKRQPELDPDSLDMEDYSTTTRDNLQFSHLKINDPETKGGYLSNQYHLRYIRSLAKNLGIKPVILAAEPFAIERDPSLRPVLEDWYNSPEMRSRKRQQTILQKMLLIDEYANIPQLIAVRARR